MNAEDRREQLVILNLQLQHKEAVLERLARVNRYGRTPKDLADLDADYGMAKAAVLRLQREIAAIIDSAATSA